MDNIPICQSSKKCLSTYDGVVTLERELPDGHLAKICFARCPSGKFLQRANWQAIVLSRFRGRKFITSWGENGQGDTHTESSNQRVQLKSANVSSTDSQISFLCYSNSKIETEYNWRMKLTQDLWPNCHETHIRNLNVTKRSRDWIPNRPSRKIDDTHSLKLQLRIFYLCCTFESPLNGACTQVMIEYTVTNAGTI